MMRLIFNKADTLTVEVSVSALFDFNLQESGQQQVL